MPGLRRWGSEIPWGVSRAPYPIFWLHTPTFLVFYLVCQVLAAACGIQFPDQGLNLGPLHWECSLSH